jgi:hypothetical protein
MVAYNEGEIRSRQPRVPVGLSQVLCARSWGILAERTRDQLRHTIRDRDATYGTWGFKFSMLCDALTPAEIALFTNLATDSSWTCVR